MPTSVVVVMVALSAIVGGTLIYVLRRCRKV